MKIEARLRRDSALMRAHALIDWESFVLILLDATNSKPVGPEDKSS